MRVSTLCRRERQFLAACRKLNLEPLAFYVRAGFEADPQISEKDAINDHGRHSLQKERTGKFSASRAVHELIDKTLDLQSKPPPRAKKPKYKNRRVHGTVRPVHHELRV